MTSNGTYVSLYDQRVQLVAAALTVRSELTEKAAIELAGTSCTPWTTYRRRCATAASKTRDGDRWLKPQ